MKKYILLLLLSTQIVFAGEEQKGNGGDLVGNGGDGQVIEFRNLGLEIAEKLQQMNPTCQSLLSLKPLDLIQIIYRARIESSKKDLELNGRRVEAINYPKLNKIIFNISAFEINKNQKQFVIHEFLGLMGIADIKK